MDRGLWILKCKSAEIGLRLEDGAICDKGIEINEIRHTLNIFSNSRYGI